MTVIFFYSYTNTSFIWLIITILADIIINLFIIQSSKNQSEGVIRTNLLYKAGIINVIFILIIPLIPEMVISDFSSAEFQLFKLIYFIQQSILPISTLITSGLLFHAFGKVNSEYIDTFLSVSGLLMVISVLLNLLSLFFYVLFMFEPLFLDPGFDFKGSLVWVIRTVFFGLEMSTYAVSMILYYIHGKVNKDKYILRSLLAMILRGSVLYIAYYILINTLGP